MRERFNEQLQRLNVELIRMGALCEEGIQHVLDAIRHDDVTHLEEIRRIEEEIDHQEKEIEALCMKLLLHQQPVARDLRVISSALKMISDMERIGDQAADISEIVPYIVRCDVKGKEDLGKMGEAVTRMVTGSVDAFVKHDLELAHQVMADDDVVDEYFARIRKTLIWVLKADPERGSTGLDMLMIAKYLERIGDHAVNIAEWVEFSITGRHKDE